MATKGNTKTRTTKRKRTDENNTQSKATKSKTRSSKNASGVQPPAGQQPLQYSAPGNWTPRDDFILKELILSTHDLRKVARSTKFSQKFSLREIVDRWNSLLYDKELSNEATKHVASLPANKRTPWRKDEEDLLLAITDVNPNYQALLENHRIKFHPNRTVKSIALHHAKLKSAGLMSKHIKLTNSVRPEKTPEGIKTEETIGGTRYVPYSPITTQPAARNQSFSQFEKALYTTPYIKTEELKPSEKNAIQSRRREYMKLEDQSCARTLQLERWFESTKEANKESDTFAQIKTLNGLEYKMKKYEILLGRESKEDLVDVNTHENSTETDDTKFLTPKALIILDKNDIDFYIINLTKIPIMINGVPVLLNEKKKIEHSLLIEMGDFKCLFDINNTLIGSMKKQLTGSIPPTLMSYPPPLEN